MSSCNNEATKYTGESKRKSSSLRGWRDTKTRKRLQNTKFSNETETEAATRRAKEAERKRIYRKLKKNQQNAEHAAQIKPLPTIRFNTEVKMNSFRDVNSVEITEYKKLYPKLENITDRPVHCTSCNSHIGTAPISEAIIRMHPVLRVIQCKNCYTFYTSGEFECGADGSEYYCRWCGQGGEVYCCSKCPKVFCRRCIEHNVSKCKVDEIQNNENWMCFACDPSCIVQLRADYWALLSFIEEQKKKIGNSSLTEKELNDAMSKDYSKCCLNVTDRINSKRKLTNSTDSTRPAKRTDTGKLIHEPSLNIDTSLVKREEIDLPIFKSLSGITGTSSSCDTNSITSKSIIHAPSPHMLLVRPLNVASVVNTTQPFQTLSQSVQTLSQSVQTPSQSVQQNLLLDILTSSPAKNIVFHTNNGFRVDLNRTGEQESYLLQNGKLIQVEKHQVPLPNGSKKPIPLVKNPIVPRFAPPSGDLCRPVLHNSPLTKFQPLRTHPSLPLQQRKINPILQNPNKAVPVPNKVQPTQNAIQTTSVPKTTTKRKKKGKPSAVDKAKAQFETRVKNSLEVCRQIIGKLRKLTKSTAFKSIKTVAEVKDLVMHLSYLLTFGCNRFKTLQEKFRDDMKIMGFDPDLNSDDDVEILEPKTTLIDLDSDESDSSDLERETRKATENLITIEKIVGQLVENVSISDTPVTHRNGEGNNETEVMDIIAVPQDTFETTGKTSTLKAYYNNIEIPEIAAGDTSENDNLRIEKLRKNDILSSVNRDKDQNIEQNMEETILKENRSPMKFNEDCEPTIHNVTEIVIKCESKNIPDTFGSTLENKANPDGTNNERVKDVNNETTNSSENAELTNEEAESHAGEIISSWNSKTDLLRELMEKSGLSQELNEHSLLKKAIDSIYSDNILKDIADNEFDIFEEPQAKFKTQRHLEDISDSEELNPNSTKICENIEEKNQPSKDKSKSETEITIDILGKDTNPVMKKDSIYSDNILSDIADNEFDNLEELQGKSKKPRYLEDILDSEESNPNSTKICENIEEKNQPSKDKSKSETEITIDILGKDTNPVMKKDSIYSDNILSDIADNEFDNLEEPQGKSKQPRYLEDISDSEESNPNSTKICENIKEKNQPSKDESKSETDITIDILGKNTNPVMKKDSIYSDNILSDIADNEFDNLEEPQGKSKQPRYLEDISDSGKSNPNSTKICENIKEKNQPSKDESKSETDITIDILGKDTNPVMKKDSIYSDNILSDIADNEFDNLEEPQGKSKQPRYLEDISDSGKSNPNSTKICENIKEKNQPSKDESKSETDITIDILGKDTNPVKKKDIHNELSKSNEIVVITEESVTNELDTVCQDS